MLRGCLHPAHKPWKRGAWWLKNASLVWTIWPSEVFAVWWRVAIKGFTSEEETLRFHPRLNSRFSDNKVELKGRHMIFLVLIRSPAAAFFSRFSHQFQIVWWIMCFVKSKSATGLDFLSWKKYRLLNIIV